VWSEERAQAESASGGAQPESRDAPPESGGGERPAVAAEQPTGGDAPSSDVARLYLNLGRKDGASEKEIRDLLSAYAEGPSVMDIDVMNTHTYLNVAPSDADKIIGALTGKELSGRQLVCETAKPRRR
jgi:hypothetical protein